MYGLTEAFRSTYLPPEEVDRRPDSIGKAIPNAEILVLREDGTPCAPDEPGELVHRGALVGMGYWNDPEKTAERYKPLPLASAAARRACMLPEIAVFSGDTVRTRRGGLPLLHRPPRRDDQDLGLSRQPDRGRGGAVRHAAGRRVRGIRRRPSDARPGDRGRRHARRTAARRSTSTRCWPSAARACRRTWCRQASTCVPGPLPRNPNGKIDRKAAGSTEWLEQGARIGMTHGDTDSARAPLDTPR